MVVESLLEDDEELLEADDDELLEDDDDDELSKLRPVGTSTFIGASMS